MPIGYSTKIYRIEGSEIVRKTYLYWGRSFLVQTFIGFWTRRFLGLICGEILYNKV